MLNDLVNAKLISYEDAQEYQLFAVDQAGREWFQRKMHETFMEEVPKEVMNSANIGFVDGRRSILRQVCFVIEHVQQQIRKYQDDLGKSESKPESK